MSMTETSACSYSTAALLLSLCDRLLLKATLEWRSLQMFARTGHLRPGLSFGREASTDPES